MVAGKSLQCFIESVEESLEENPPILIEIEPLGSVGTLLFYQIEPLKNGPSSVLHSSSFRDS